MPYIHIEVSDQFAEEVQRIKRETGMDTREQFKKAYSLLRIFVEAEQEGKRIVMMDGKRERELCLPKE